MNLEPELGVPGGEQEVGCLVEKTDDMVGEG